MNRKHLILTFDVTDLPEWEVSALAFEASVQSEASSEYTLYTTEEYEALSEDERSDAGHRDVGMPQEAVVETYGDDAVEPVLMTLGELSETLAQVVDLLNDGTDVDDEQAYVLSRASDKLEAARRRLLLAKAGS